MRVHSSSLAFFLMQCCDQMSPFTWATQQPPQRAHPWQPCEAALSCTCRTQPHTLSSRPVLNPVLCTLQVQAHEELLPGAASPAVKDAHGCWQPVWVEGVAGSGSYYKAKVLWADPEDQQVEVRLIGGECVGVGVGMGVGVGAGVGGRV